MLAIALGAAAVVWWVLLVTAPVQPAPLAGTLYAFGSLICHQLSDRSFHLAGAQLPVCARCLGIYAGAAAGLVTAAVRSSLPAVASPRALLAIAAVPTVATVTLEWAGIWASSNGVRLMAGIVLGLGAALSLAPALRTHLSAAPVRRERGSWAPEAGPGSGSRDTLR